MADDSSPQNADITWDENGLPSSSQFDDIYFSKTDGIAESRYVFIAGNKLEQRWQHLKKDERFVIAETGFGTGLNFLLTWQAWDTHPKTDAAFLHFISVEKYPLRRQDLHKALTLWPSLNKYIEALLDAYPPQPTQGQYQLQFSAGKVTLTLCFNEASSALGELLPTEKPGPNVTAALTISDNAFASVNAWYLDGFAPARNPDMWQDELFDLMRLHSKPGTSIATFTAAGAVRRSLLRIGVSCEKIRGFGTKREMLIGEFGLTQSNTSNHDDAQPNNKPNQPVDHFRDYKQQKIDASPSWHICEHKASSRPKHCIVIGGGLAGCHTAFALAQKNISVTLLEKNTALATEASGNEQGIVYAKMSRQASPLNQFIHAALHFATRFYHTHNCYAEHGDACGVLHLATSPALEKQYRDFCQHFKDEPEFVTWLSAEQCKHVSGLTSQHPALFLPQTGWLTPAKVCQQLCEHPLIQVKLESEVDNIVQCQIGEDKHNGWEIQVKDQRHMADAVVLANAASAQQFSASKHLPLKAIRGQVTHLPANTVSQGLRSVICGDGYIAPAHKGQHCTGASFNLHHHDSALRADDHRDNLDKLLALSPNLHFPEHSPETLDGKVGFRCTTPDYLPIVGSVPDRDEMRRRFGFLRKKANAVIDDFGAYHSQLYINVGHGSRGLCYTPLAAAVLAAEISGDYLPIETSLYRFLHPARFIIRDLMRNKD